MSDRFDKNLRKEFEKNMAISHPNINISNLSKVDESDLHNYYFNASYEAEELLLKFIQSNDKIDINNLYFKLNPIFFRQEEAFSDWYDDFRLNEWINNTTTFNDNASLILFNGGNNKSKEKLALKKIKVKGYDGSEHFFKKFFLCEHSKCDCFIFEKGQAVNSLNAPINDGFLKIYLDISQLYPEYFSFLNDSSQYIFYSGVYKMVELENLSEEVLDVLSQDRVLAKYVARHNNISGKLITKLIKLEDLEINTSLFNNPKVDKGIKKQLLSSGVIDENRYPLSQRIFDLENLGEYDSKYFRLKK
jgi:hypothetical protein